MKRIALAGMVVVALAASAAAQPTPVRSQTGPFVLVRANHKAAYYLSGIQNSAEPGAVEAWLWTVYGDYALAIASTYRCEAGTLETYASETYVKGEQTEAAPMLNAPFALNPNNGFGASLKLACSADATAAARTFKTLREALAYSATF